MADTALKLVEIDDVNVGPIDELLDILDIDNFLDLDLKDVETQFKLNDVMPTPIPVAQAPNVRSLDPRSVSFKAVENQVRQTDSEAVKLLLNTYWLPLLETSIHDPNHFVWRDHIKLMVDLVFLSNPNTKIDNPRVAVHFLPNLLNKIARVLKQSNGDSESIDTAIAAIKFEPSPLK